MSRSSENTTNDSSEPKSAPENESDLKRDILTGDSPDDVAGKTSQANATLGEKLEKVNDARGEERFIWIVIVVILVDVLWFKDSPNPTLPIVVMAFQLILLIVIGRRMGIDDVVTIIDKLLSTVGSKGSNGG